MNLKTFCEVLFVYKCKHVKVLVILEFVFKSITLFLHHLVQDADSMDRLSPVMLPSDHPPHLSHHASLTGKDTLTLPDSDVVTRSRSLKSKRNSSDGGGTRPASIAVFGSPHSIRRSSKTGSSTSLNSDCVDAPIVNHEEILQLTRDVRTFSESLGRLKFIFNQDGGKIRSSFVFTAKQVFVILHPKCDAYKNTWHDSVVQGSISQSAKKYVTHVS